ncbi:hypothetical protein RSOLAG22IIIB_10989 [Rhizoctonia solani]|uniref:Uncharacterized protein n=1 Tax=Rhizoctonia solani TaxID=456999 RepID=A0A0K6G6J7_9AGAM|nr:hypothetical protein RSOLAG22IIIB_10989 [Rhizoctonia solani]
MDFLEQQAQLINDEELLHQEQEKQKKWYCNFQNALMGCDNVVTNFYNEYVYGGGYPPSEETLTQILICDLRRYGNFEVEEPNKHAEGHDGYDIRIKIYHPVDTLDVWYPDPGVTKHERRVLWVCYLQSKRHDDREIDFAYRLDKALKSSKNQANIDTISNIKAKLEATEKQYFQEWQTMRAEASEIEQHYANDQTKFERKKNKLEAKQKKIEAEYGKDFDSLYTMLRKYEDQGHFQIELLANTLEATTPLWINDHPDCQVTGGYLVYGPEGVIYYPIKEIVQAYDNAKTEGSSKGSINRSMTTFLGAAPVENRRLVTTLPEYLALPSQIYTQLS